MPSGPSDLAYAMVPGCALAYGSAAGAVLGMPAGGIMPIWKPPAGEGA